MDLSIVIVSWNTAELLTQCLDSIYATAPACDFEVLVVDNASSDGSPAAVRARFPQVWLIENERNVGFATANNQAIAMSQGRYVLLLNPDTEVCAGALDHLMRFMDAQPAVGAVGARLLNPDGTLQHSCYPAPTLARELARMFHVDRPFRYQMEQWDTLLPRKVDVVLGACLLARRAALRQVGLLDESYFMYSEEVDLCYRLRRGGWPIFWVPQAEVVHYGGQSTRQVAAEMFLQLYRAKVLYFRKHYGPVAASLYKGILLAASLARLALTPLAWLTPHSQRQQRLTLATHYRRLVAELVR